MCSNHFLETAEERDKKTYKIANTEIIEEKQQLEQHKKNYEVVTWAIMRFFINILNQFLVVLTE